MKYINREYGFSGRPPEFMDYYEETDRGPIITAANFPDTEIVGAGLDSAAPYGAMLIGKNGTKWGIKLSCNIRGRWVDSTNYLKDIGRLFAASKNGNFTYFAYGDMTAAVIKYSKKALVMSIATMDSIKLRITFYLMKPCEGEIRYLDNDIIKGAANYCAVISGNVELESQKSVYRDRYEIIGEPRDKEYFTAKLYRKPLEVKQEGNSITYEYDLQDKESRLFIYAAVGDKNIFNNYPLENELIEGASMEEIAYSTTKTIGRGTLGRSANGFLNSSLYHKIFNPYTKGFMYVESRTKTDKYYSFTGTDLNSASIIASYIGDYETVKSQLCLAINDEILSPLALWIDFIRTRDINLLKTLYRDFSRKFIPEGDLVIAYGDKSDVSYCMDKSPLREINNNKPMYSLDKSCINLLSMDIMERVAMLVGAPESSLYCSAKERLKTKINDLLWNPKLGIYMNRYVDGDFSESYGITSFYPLIAGAVDGLDKLEKLMSYLRDKKKFNSERMLVTLSKDHPEYGVKLTYNTDVEIMPYNSYRGEIIPYMNFLIYQGLIRYGVYDLAGELADKSAVMWNKRYRKGNYEVLDRYLPGKVIRIDKNSLKLDTERISSDTERHSLSGNLLALMGLSELIDLEYFRDDMKASIRFGTYVKGEQSISRIAILGRQYTVNIDDRGLKLSVDNQEVLQGIGGKFIVRNFTENNSGCEFTILCETDINLSIKLPIIGLCTEISSLSFKVESGCSKIFINNGKLNIKKIY